MNAISYNFTNSHRIYCLYQYKQDFIKNAKILDLFKNNSDINVNYTFD